MHTQTTVALSLLAMGISTIAVIRANRDEQIRDEFSDAHGDVPTLPEGLRRAAIGPGGGRKAARSQGIAHDIAHRGKVATR